VRDFLLRPFLPRDQLAVDVVQHEA
jgi:hypothetical protein